MLAMIRRRQSRVVRHAVLSGCTAIFLCAESAAQKRILGPWPCKSALLHPRVIAELPGYGLAFAKNVLPLHASVPARLEIRPGKREYEYLIKCDPPVKRTRLIVPDLIKIEFVYARKLRRTHRWQIGESPIGLCAKSYTGALLVIKKHQVMFIDLDHDGAFGGRKDAYIVRPPKKRQWLMPGEAAEFRQMTQEYEVKGQKIWFDVDPRGFSVLVSDQPVDYSADRLKDYQAALVYVNMLRSRLGYAPVVLDDELTAGCEQHSLYCAINGQTHEQSQKLDGYSRAGAVAGRASNVVRADTMTGAIDVWLDSFYHRPFMISPQLSAVGMGLIRGHATMDILTRLVNGRFEAYHWPFSGQEGVPVTWRSGETPSPIGGDNFTRDVARTYGYPVTVTFDSPRVADVKAQIFDLDKSLPVFVTSPARPGNAEFVNNMNSILVMTTDPLRPKTVYRVLVECTYRGKPWQREWQFTTE